MSRIATQCFKCHAWPVQVVHCFGNVYKCQNTGSVHVCDQNCEQQMLWDRHSTICKMSRKLSPRSDVPNDSCLRCDLQRSAQCRGMPAQQA